MKINCLFPIFEENNAKLFFDKFFKSSFYEQNKNCSLLIYVNSKDENNIKTLKSLTKKHKNILLNLVEKDFNYNDVFLNAIQTYSCDVLLLGDTQIENIDRLFNALIEKHLNGANIVHIKKKSNKFETFFKNIFSKFYNFFVNLFSYQNDALNVTSLGLIDKNIIDVLLSLPNKATRLKNCTKMYGFNIDYLYIDKNIKTYKPKRKKILSYFKQTWITLSIFFVSLLIIILGNIYMDKSLILFNFFMIAICLINLVLSVTFFFKNALDLRTKTSCAIKDLIIKKIEKEKK